VWLVQDEFCGFTDDDVRRFSKRTSSLRVLRENLLKRSQPSTSGRPVNSQYAKKQRTVSVKTVSSSHIAQNEVTSSPLSSSQSDSSPTRGSLKGNIKVRLLLGRYKLFPTPKERHNKTVLGKATRNDVTVLHAAAVAKERRKRRRSSVSQLDDSVTAISSSEESDIKYCLSDETSPPVLPRRGRPPLHGRPSLSGRPQLSGHGRGRPPLRGRPALHPAALVQARARQLVSKAREGQQVDKKPATTRPWAPFWHGKLQLPTQSSRSSRKITVNRRFLDDSYTSLGQSGLSQPSEIAKTAHRPVTQGDRPSTKHDNAEVNSNAGSRVRGVGLLNRPLGSKPVIKQWRLLQSGDKTSVGKAPRVRQRKPRSRSASELETKENAIATDARRRRTSKTLDTTALLDTEAPWIKNADKSVYSNQVKKGSVKGKHCYICDSASQVHHYFMCRVPCCHGCAMFYKRHCERGTQLDQLTCARQGKSSSSSVVIVDCFYFNQQFSR